MRKIFIFAASLDVMCMYYVWVRMVLWGPASGGKWHYYIICYLTTFIAETFRIRVCGGVARRAFSTDMKLNGKWQMHSLDARSGAVCWTEGQFWIDWRRNWNWNSVLIIWLAIVFESIFSPFGHFGFICLCRKGIQQPGLTMHSTVSWRERPPTQQQRTKYRTTNESAVSRNRKPDRWRIIFAKWKKDKKIKLLAKLRRLTSCCTSKPRLILLFVLVIAHTHPSRHTHIIVSNVVCTKEFRQMSAFNKCNIAHRLLFSHIYDT